MDLNDASLLVGNFGFDGTAPAASLAGELVIPAPASLTRFGLGSLFMLRRRR